jgi:hypothetical protein
MRIRLLAVALTLPLLGGCVPQLNLSLSPHGCGTVQQSAYHRTRIMATTQRVQALQARYSLASRNAMQLSNAHWKQAATGECR